jgi:hypothetical protein
MIWITRYSVRTGSSWLPGLPCCLPGLGGRPRPGACRRLASGHGAGKRPLRAGFDRPAPRSRTTGFQGLQVRLQGPVGKLGRDAPEGREPGGTQPAVSPRRGREGMHLSRVALSEQGLLWCV